MFSRKVVLQILMAGACLCMMGACTPTAAATLLPPQSPLPPTLPPVPSATPTQSPPLSEAVIKNAEYRIADLVDFGASADTVRLVNGEFNQSEDNPQVVRLSISIVKYAVGDLNGDGVEDAAVMLALNTGGSGTFMHLAAMINQGGTLNDVDTIALGDRTGTEVMSIVDGKVNLSLVTHAPQDPLCCPTLKTQMTYQMADQHLASEAEMAVAPGAKKAIAALQNGNLQDLAALAHPTKGVRFSPYSTVSDQNRVFKPDLLAGLADDRAVYLWGSFDGSGEPMQLTFADYYQKFIYNVDFSQSKYMSYDQLLYTGNAIDNAREFYPGAVIVEYYEPGTEAYGFMDWYSLRLVFEQENSQWYLTGIIHGQWTI